MAWSEISKITYHRYSRLAYSPLIIKLKVDGICLLNKRAAYITLEDLKTVWHITFLLQCDKESPHIE